MCILLPLIDAELLDCSAHYEQIVRDLSDVKYWALSSPLSPGVVDDDDDDDRFVEI